MIGWAFRQVVIWGGMVVVFYVVASRVIMQPSATAPGTAASEPAAAAPRGAMPNTLVYHANTQGHVLLEADVNGTPVHFLLDTGATQVALTLNDAAAAGLGRSDLAFKSTVATANGPARVAPVTLREVRIGQFSTGDVPAVVIENLGISLLGQSFLKRLDSYEMRDGLFTVNWN